MEKNVGEGEWCTLSVKEGFLTPYLVTGLELSLSFLGRGRGNAPIHSAVVSVLLPILSLIIIKKECLCVQFVYARIVHMCVSTHEHMCRLCTWRHQARIRSVPGFPPSPRQGLFNPELTDLRMLASQLTPKIWTFTFRTLELQSATIPAEL